ncbi:hypothetical protein Tco_0950016 [Tanacetum coccineum]
MLIHLHHRDLFIDHLLGLYDVVRHLDIRADLLPPRKRFEIHTHTSIAEREHTECGVLLMQRLVADIVFSEGVFEDKAIAKPTCAANALEDENQSQNGSDGGNGNGGNGNGGNENGRGDRPVARECTYQDFMKC